MSKEPFKIKEYPELVAVAQKIAKETCIKINSRAVKVKSEMPYRQQFVLEELIKILESKV